MMDHDSWRGAGTDDNGVTRIFAVGLVGAIDFEGLENHIAKLMGEQ